MYQGHRGMNFCEIDLVPGKSLASQLNRITLEQNAVMIGMNT